MDRRTFIHNTTLLAGGLGLAGTTAFAAQQKNKNKLPQWRGFNLVDFNTPNPKPDRRYTTEEQLQWMADWGFNFVRLPIAYPYYVRFDRSKNMTPDDVYIIDGAAVDRIDQLVQRAHKHNLHVSLN